MGIDGVAPDRERVPGEIGARAARHGGQRVPRARDPARRRRGGRPRRRLQRRGAPLGGPRRPVSLSEHAALGHRHASAERAHRAAHGARGRDLGVTPRGRRDACAQRRPRQALSIRRRAGDRGATGRGVAAGPAGARRRLDPRVVRRGIQGARREGLERGEDASCEVSGVGTAAAWPAEVTELPASSSSSIPVPISIEPVEELHVPAPVPRPAPMPAGPARPPPRSAISLPTPMVAFEIPSEARIPLGERSLPTLPEIQIVSPAPGVPPPFPAAPRIQPPLPARRAVVAEPPQIERPPARATFRIRPSGPRRRTRPWSSPATPDAAASGSRSGRCRCSYSWRCSFGVSRCGRRRSRPCVCRRPHRSPLHPPRRRHRLRRRWRLRRRRPRRRPTRRRQGSPERRRRYRARRRPRARRGSSRRGPGAPGRRPATSASTSRRGSDRCARACPPSSSDRRSRSLSPRERARPARFRPAQRRSSAYRPRRGFCAGASSSPPRSTTRRSRSSPPRTRSWQAPTRAPRGGALPACHGKSRRRVRGARAHRSGGQGAAVAGPALRPRVGRGDRRARGDPAAARLRDPHDPERHGHDRRPGGRRRASARRVGGAGARRVGRDRGGRADPGARAGQAHRVARGRAEDAAHDRRAVGRAQLQSAAPQPCSPPAPPPPEGHRPSPLRLGAYAAGGVGVVGLAVFTIGGLAAHSTYNDLGSACHDGPCPADKQGEISSGKTQQTIANVGLVFGVAGVAAGATLFVLSLPKGAATSSASLVASPGWIGVDARW